MVMYRNQLGLITRKSESQVLGVGDPQATLANAQVVKCEGQRRFNHHRALS
jgi:hypothetical protein